MYKNQLTPCDDDDLAAKKKVTNEKIEKLKTISTNFGFLQMRLLKLFSVDDRIKHILGLQFEALLIHPSVDKNSLYLFFFIPHYLR